MTGIRDALRVSLVAYLLVLTSAEIAGAQDTSGSRLYGGYDSLEDFVEAIGEATNLWIDVQCGINRARDIPSNEFDAFGHCWAACTYVRACGSNPICVLAGYAREEVRELADLFGIEEHDSFDQDIDNQVMGIVPGINETGRSCFGICEQNAATGRLNYTAPQRIWRDCRTGEDVDEPCLPMAEIQQRAATMAADRPVQPQPSGPFGGFLDSLADATTKVSCRVALLPVIASLEGEQVPDLETRRQMFEACKIDRGRKICELEAAAWQARNPGALPPPSTPVDANLRLEAPE